MKIAYCGYDFFASCLEALIEDGHELVELFTFPTDNEYDFNDRVMRVAQTVKARITLSPMRMDDVERLGMVGVDMIISAAYPYKIPDWNGHVKYAVNVHPSPLPVGRGPWPLPWIILKGLPMSAVTLHEVNSKWDRGDILLQEPFEVFADETLESLSIRSQLRAVSLIKRAMPNMVRLWQEKTSQASGTYWPMPQKADRTIKWDSEVGLIARQVRAFSKFETFLYIDGVRYFVRGVSVWKEQHSLPPGTVAHRTNREVVYAALDGFVCLSYYMRADEHEIKS